MFQNLAFNLFSQWRAAPICLHDNLVHEDCIRYIWCMLDWSQCPAVERVPGKVSGAWLFKGTRVPVKA